MIHIFRWKLLWYQVIHTNRERDSNSQSLHLHKEVRLTITLWSTICHHIRRNNMNNIKFLYCFDRIWIENCLFSSALKYTYLLLVYYFFTPILHEFQDVLTSNPYFCNQCLLLLNVVSYPIDLYNNPVLVSSYINNKCSNVSTNTTLIRIV